ncbi:hypothetical protein BDU57DRAFT_533771 [Ampelomyces quisqualis]|uniref:Uncharacterized protein n=1 Tax=Ampelomyces quisqualis TaxID=50730 RepID=A0A6A5Q5Z4_AMPQU|nr:hypothetical protein BDU57DRAFT_533771 [Ampelomyces quisqualis]
MSAMKLRSSARQGRQNLPTPPTSTASSSSATSRQLSSSSPSSYQPPSQSYLSGSRSQSSMSSSSQSSGPERCRTRSRSGTPSPSSGSASSDYRLDFGRNKGRTLDECEQASAAAASAASASWTTKHTSQPSHPAALAQFSTDLSARANAGSHAHTAATVAKLHTHIARRGLDTQRLAERLFERQAGEVQAVRRDVRDLAQLLDRTAQLQGQVDALQKRVPGADQRQQLQAAESRAVDVQHQLDLHQSERGAQQRHVAEVQRLAKESNTERIQYSQALESTRRVMDDEARQNQCEHALQINRTQFQLRTLQEFQARQQLDVRLPHNLSTSVLQQTTRIDRDEHRQAEHVLRTQNQALQARNRSLAVLNVRNNVQHGHELHHLQRRQQCNARRAEETMRVLDAAMTEVDAGAADTARAQAAARPRQGQPSTCPPTSDYKLLARVARAETEAFRL